MYFLVALPCVFALLFYLYRKFYCHRLFKRLGIPGPEPHWLHGNILQLSRKDRHLLLAEWTSKYGHIYGIYYGARPILVIGSTEAVEQVCVKQFSNFQGHMFQPIQPDPEKRENNPFAHMLFAQGETWKRYRSVCNPAFSSGKLKSYMPLLSKSQQDFIELLSAKARSEESFDIRECYQRLTLDVISEVAFSLELEAIKNRGKGHDILENLRAWLHNVANPPTIVSSALILTELNKLFEWLLEIQVRFHLGFFAPTANLMTSIGNIIDQRRKLNSRPNDLLQMMLDVSSNAVPSDVDDKRQKDAHQSKDAGSHSKTMSDVEIALHCLLFFIGGYETTSNTLGFVSYLLARHPHVQEKLAGVISASFPKKNDQFPDIDYETAMNQIPYLDWVCKETLRMYPVVMVAMSRFIRNDTTLCGVRIPKDVAAVIMDVWTIHNDESLWGPVDVSKFYPERFSPENSESRPDSAFLPFGFGPRLCLGKRLALLEMKVTLANMLLRFRIVEPDGSYPMDGIPISSMSGPLLPIGGIPVKLVPRSL